MLEETGSTWILLAIILSALALLTGIAAVLGKAARYRKYIDIADTLKSRVRIWWGMSIVFAVAALTGGIGSVLVFGFTSFLLLREFITITPTRQSDYGALFLAFFVILPLQYYLLWNGWYGLFIILIPVYGFLLIPLRMAVAGDAHGFLERAAKIQWALMICVYCVSHAPALLKINFGGDPGLGLRLLLYLCVIVQANDVVQTLCLQGQERQSEKMTGAAFLSGLFLSATLGLSLSWATHFSVLQSVGMAVLIMLMGTAGNICYAAIVQDRGKPGIVVVQTRPPMIERIISLCFAAPIFFHITRFFFTNRPPIPF